MPPKVARLNVAPLVWEKFVDHFGELGGCERLANTGYCSVFGNYAAHILFFQSRQHNHGRRVFAAGYGFQDSHRVNLGVGIDDNYVKVVEIFGEEFESIARVGDLTETATSDRCRVANDLVRWRRPCD